MPAGEEKTLYPVEHWRLNVGGAEADEGAGVHEHHAALEVLGQEGVVLVVLGRQGVHGHGEAEHLGVEGLRALQVVDGEADVVDRSQGERRHGGSLRRRAAPA